MEKKFKKFKKDVKETLRKKYEDEIEAAVLFGSFAKGTAKEGSDLDILIQLKPGIMKEEVESLRSVLERLDEKHEIGGGWVYYDPILRLVHPMVLCHDEIDWKEGKIKNFIAQWVIKMGISEPIFFKHLKEDGEVLLGKNVLKMIDVSPNVFNRLVNATGDPFYKLWKAWAKKLYSIFYE